LFETKPIKEVKPGLGLVMKLEKEKISKSRKTLDERRNFRVLRR
jgi:coenzyme F420 hydrogenase subunit beta